MLHQALLLSLGQEDDSGSAGAAAASAGAGGSGAAASGAAASGATGSGDAASSAAPKPTTSPKEKLDAILSRAAWDVASAESVSLPLRRSVWTTVNETRDDTLKETLRAIWGPPPPAAEESEAFKTLQEARGDAKRVMQSFLQVLPDACIKVGLAERRGLWHVTRAALVPVGR